MDFVVEDGQTTSDHYTQHQTQTQFVNEKLWKVRWISNNNTDSRFVTATYGGRQNEFALWTPVNDAKSHECFKKEQFLSLESDIRDLLVINRKNFAVALNDGSVSLVELNGETFVAKHKFEPPNDLISAHALCGDENGIFIGYSNGTIRLNDYNSSGPSTRWTITDLSSVQSLSLMTSNVIVSAHISGTIYVWDTRQKSDIDGIPQPAFSCIATQLCDAVTAIANHPADVHMVGYGTSSGMVELVDTRLNENMAESNPLPLASGPVWEVGFHPDYPRNFYGAWNGGHLLHFETGAIRITDSMPQSSSLEEKVARFSRLGDARLTELVQNHGSINTFSVSSKGILVGADNATLTLIQSDYFT